MASINIDRRIDDPFGRYQMPRLSIQNQGGKTILVNIFDVGKALHRSPLYITKFFSYEFSVPIRLDTKQNCYIMSGHQDRETLQNAVHRFIEYFVLCSRCNNPETELILGGRKRDEVHKVCAACGHESPDNMKSQRLTAFIAKSLRDTPEVKTTNVIFNERPDELRETDDDWSQYDSLIILIEKMKNENKLNDLDSIKGIIVDAEQSNLMKKAPLIIAKYLFTENILKEIDEYKILFQQFCKNNLKGQKYLLYALEVLINDQNKIRRQIFHTKIILEILHKFYDYEIIEKGTFIHWYKKCSKHLTNKSTSRKIRQMANEFIQELNQSDNEDSDSKEIVVSENPTTFSDEDPIE